MREMRQDRLAFDLQSARTVDPDSGHMHVRQTNISKATVNPYLGSEIPGAEELGLDPNKEYRLLRHPAELERAAATFNGKPLVLSHKAQAVDDKDHENRVGSIGGATYEHPYLKADLSIWDQAAIQAIESEAQRELSCGYAYHADMTPGSYENQRYDGVMRNLRGNHVALVREGRAGPDCHVFDQLPQQLRDLGMSKTAAVSGTAIGSAFALRMALRPKMAKDAKPIDWTPLFKGVTAKNFKAKKPAMAIDMKRQLAGKLAKDADMNDVVELLDALEDIIPEAGPDLEFKQVGDLPDAGEAETGAQDDDQADLKAVLAELGILEDDIAKVCAKLKGGASAMDDDNDSQQSQGSYGQKTGIGKDLAPSNMGTGNTEEAGAAYAVGGSNGSEEAGGGEMRSYAPTESNPSMLGSAKDEDDRDAEQREKDGKAFVKKVTGMDVKDLKSMVTKTAMDSAIAAAVQAAEKRATANQAAIREAERTVRPWVGDLAMSFDSADKVYRAALSTLGVDGADKMHADALLPVLQVQPKPGEQNRQRPSSAAHLAQDAAAQSEYEKRFPHANRLSRH